MHGKTTALALSSPADMESYGVVKSRTEGFILAVCRIHAQLSTRWATQKPRARGLRVLRSTHSAVVMGNEAHERVETGRRESAGVCLRIHPSRAHLHDGMRCVGSPCWLCSKMG
ncbi:hypothetical protein V8C34DRAFT_243858 [Trichoderma compactum]